MKIAGKLPVKAKLNMNMNVDELLKRWAAKRLEVTESEVLDVTFRHEDGWINDSGTSWPEENIVIVKLKGQGKGIRKREFYTESFEDLPALLKEILDA